MFYRCMGDFNANGFSQLLEQFGGEYGSFVSQDMRWNVRVFGKYRQRSVNDEYLSGLRSATANK